MNHPDHGPTGRELPVVLIILVLLLLPVIAPAGQENRNRRPGQSGRVAVVSIEGMGIADVPVNGVVGRIGRISGSPRVACGRIRRRPLPGSDLVWAESMTGMFVEDRPEFRLVGHTALWDVARSNGIPFSVFARIQATVPPAESLTETGQDSVDLVARDDQDRIDGALAAWRGRSVDLVILRVESVILDLSLRSGVRASVRTLVERCINGFLEGIGPDGTVIFFSSAAPGNVDGLTREQSGKTPMAPGLVLAAGRGVGGRSWPTIARLADVTPTALFLLGLSPLPRTHGTVLHDLLEPSFLFHRTVERPKIDQSEGEAR